MQPHLLSCIAPGGVAVAEPGIVIARLPFYMVVDRIADGRLCRLLPEWEIAPQPIYLVHPQRRHPTQL